ncbi:hypothetical protein [Candidatus Binatus sp.]|jgi:hypothetical protein|uniref:hypothetical protein n=1 Tax=Candidatus Binatus sp. TaxID=2811406 RepID=UPI003C8D2FD6
MLKRSLMVAAAVLMVACNSGPSQTADNTVGGANIVSSAKSPMVKATTTFSLDWGKDAKAGQVAIADVISYGGPKVAITVPAGWQLIRDDSTSTTRQSLYWHAIQANDPSTSTWTFSAPVDAQGAILLLDNVASTMPVDMTSGNTGNGGTVTAKSVATTADGALILGFYATDFHLDGLSPSLPADTTAVINQEATSNEFWILASYQNQSAATEDQVCSAAQIFNWAAAQVAIKRGTATP